MTGSWPGTTGLAYTGVYFMGLDPQGEPVWQGPSPDFLRFGPEGEPAMSVFDVAKTQNPDLLTSFIASTFWLAHLFDTPDSSVDLLVTGQTYPAYVPEPVPYRLGDPVSDEDREFDRDGINLTPASVQKRSISWWGRVGDNPSSYPEDRWVVEAAIRMIAAEDPDVFFIHLAGVDKIEHAAGAADHPQEWNDNGTPDILWDDRSYFTPYVNRDPVLDVVHEADECVGLFLDLVEDRGTAEDSIIVLFSDHSLVNYMPIFLDIKEMLREKNIPDTALKYISSGGEAASLFLNSPADLDSIENALEEYFVYHPVLEQDVHPLLVLNQQEMDTGIDGAIGPIAEDGGELHGELYSDWNIKHPRMAVRIAKTCPCLLMIKVSLSWEVWTVKTNMAWTYTGTSSKPRA